MSTKIQTNIRRASEEETEHMSASMWMRGTILHYFTIAEKVIDDIVRRLTFGSVDEYDTYIKIFQKGEMPMSTKKALMSLCISKFESKFKINFPSLVHLDNVIDKRNHLAHWILDTSDEGQKLFREKGLIKFISQDKKGEWIEPEYLNSESAKGLVERIVELTGSLVAMQEIIIAGGIEGISPHRFS